MLKNGFAALAGRSASRRQLRDAVGMAVLIALAAQTALAQEDWPRWRGPRGNGTWQGPPIADQLPAAGLTAKWKAPIGPGYSGIAVAGGYVYTMDRPKTPTDSERIVCFDAESGKRVWEHVYPAVYGDLDYGKGPRCTPTLYEDRLYALGAVGMVHCLDAATGKVLWQHDLVKDFRAKQPMWGFSASPVIYRDQVIIHASVERGAYLAFERSSGREVWRGGPDPTGYGTPILIKRDGRDELVGWTPDHILGLSLPDGKELWRIPYEVTYGVSIATPIYVDNLVVVCGYWHGSKAIQLGKAPGDAKVLWEENRWLRGIMAQPLYRDGHVYLLDKQHGLVCFDVKTGEKRWTDENKLTPRDRNPQLNMVWLGDSNRSLFLNAEGELGLVSLSPDGFQEFWRTKLVKPTWAHPAFAGQHVFARDDETLVCAALPE